MSQVINLSSIISITIKKRNSDIPKIPGIAWDFLLFHINKYYY